MNYFFVSQRQTYKIEFSQECLWAPSDGVWHHETMREVKKGDAIIQYNGMIVGIAIAVKDCYRAISPNRNEFNKWDEQGYRVDLEQFHFITQINKEKIKNSLLNCQPNYHAPLNVNGGVNQGYLFHANMQMLKVTLEEAERIDSSNEQHEIIQQIKKALDIQNDNMENYLNTSDTPPSPNEVQIMQEDLTNEIYYGVPGTGKTYAIQQKYINNEQKKENTITTTFHQSFSYEEFVEGIKAKVNPDTKQVEYEIAPGIFYKACQKAAELAGFNSIIEMIEDNDRATRIHDAIEEGKIVYFCIDEINRGNIASIFGELISLIEVSKRCGADPRTELVVTLPYSGQRFAVPANLKIIGTMNTADRSIQLLDSALRRRFRFIECQPKYTGYNEKAARILKSINNRIRALLGKDYQIGHAYFMNISDENEEFEIFECLRDKIIPLLEEYFYGETEKIRMVLNEYSLTSSDTNFYIEDTDANKPLQMMKMSLNSIS